MSTTTLPRYLTPPQAALMLGVEPPKVIAWIRSGKLRAINTSDGLRRPRWKIAPDDLRAFLASRASQPPAKAATRRRQQPLEIIEFF